MSWFKRHQRLLSAGALSPERRRLLDEHVHTLDTLWKLADAHHNDTAAARG